MNGNVKIDKIVDMATTADAYPVSRLNCEAKIAAIAAHGQAAERVIEALILVSIFSTLNIISASIGNKINRSIHTIYT